MIIYFELRFEKTFFTSLLARLVFALLISNFIISENILCPFFYAKNILTKNSLNIIHYMRYNTVTFKQVNSIKRLGEKFRLAAGRTYHVVWFTEITTVSKI